MKTYADPVVEYRRVLFEKVKGFLWAKIQTGFPPGKPDFRVMIRIDSHWRAVCWSPSEPTKSKGWRPITFEQFMEYYEVVSLCG